MQLLPKIFDPLTRAMDKEDKFPERDSLPAYLDMLLPSMRAWSEDLTETNFYVGKSWLEVRDQDNFHDTILHIFNEGGEYLRIVNGDISKGSWKLMPDGTNRMMFNYGKANELYTLAFLDPPFFVLQKHGAPHRHKYWTMGLEGAVRGLEWREYAEKLYSDHQEESSSMFYTAIVVIVIIAIILLFSLF